jgi:hypothetical protein
MDLCSGIQKIIKDYLSPILALAGRLEIEEDSLLNEFGSFTHAIEIAAENGWITVLQYIYSRVSYIETYKPIWSRTMAKASSSGSIETLALIISYAKTPNNLNRQDFCRAMLEAVKINSPEALQMLYECVQSDPIHRLGRRWIYRGIDYHKLFYNALQYNRPEIYLVLQRMLGWFSSRGRSELVSMAAQSGNRDLLQRCIIDTRMTSHPHVDGFIALGAIRGGHMDLVNEAVARGKIDLGNAWRLFEISAEIGSSEGLELAHRIIPPNKFQHRILFKKSWCVFMVLRASPHPEILPYLAENGILTFLPVLQARNCIKSGRCKWCPISKENIELWYQRLLRS